MTRFRVNLAEDQDGKSCGVFIPLPYNLAKDFPDKSEEDTSVPHFTVLFAGDLSPYDYKKFVSVVRKVCRKLHPFTADLSHYSEFLNKEGQTISHMSPGLLSGLTLAKLHGVLRRSVEAIGLKLSHSYGKSKSSIPYELQFKPHATLAYSKNKLMPYRGPKPTGSWKVTSIECWGYERYQIPLGSTTYNQPVGLTKDPRAYKYPSAVTEADDKREQIIGLQKAAQLRRHDLGLARVHAATLNKNKIDRVRQIVRMIKARKLRTGPQTMEPKAPSDKPVDEAYDHSEFMQKLDALRQRVIARDPSLKHPPSHEPNLKRTGLLIRVVRGPLVIKARRKIKITGIKKMNEVETSLKGSGIHPTPSGSGPSRGWIGLGGTLKYLKMMQDEDKKRRSRS